VNSKPDAKKVYRVNLMFEERPAAWRILAAQFDAIFKFGGAFGTNSMTPVIGKK
jgi:hypothetical protein